MRQIILDTETTGLNAKTGDRVIEIGCVELVNRRLTGNNLHFYVNPERDSDPGALAVHGLTTEFLRDKPKFAEIADYAPSKDVPEDKLVQMARLVILTTEHTGGPRKSTERLRLVRR